ncbi:DUF433 domain-containing protein [candidate division WOR-3 bacterium]|nr:DUF433 domain-containing protein [candidate division WOR-3 bacterium]
MFERITINPEVCEGKSCIRNLRMPVAIIVRMVAGGMSFSDILNAYPSLEKEDIKQALQYSALLTEEKVIVLPS